MAAHIPQEWDEVLDRVHQCLEETLHEADGRERDFEDCQSLPDVAGTLRQAMTLGEQSFAGLRDRLAAIERSFAVTEAELLATEDALRDVVERTSAARHSLADWSGRAIR